MSRRTRRSTVIAVSILALGALIGGVFGSRARADAKRPEDQLWTFGHVLSLVEEHYVGETDPQEMVEDAVGGMLRTLDPHSNYLSAEAFSEMRDEQRGRFYGLGIQITKRGPDKPLTIISPIDDTPADRAGLISGDVISEIEGKPTIDLTVHDAVRHLKGDKGTEVTITIERPGAAEPFQVTVERDEIPIESIRLAYMMEPGVGFVRISNFTSTTADELDIALEQLSNKGMEKLILDLRGNPGGLLDQAVQVSERFITARKLIVYTRGRIPGANQDFLAKRGVNRTDVPLVLLVDNSSASASEIVSGAVQDHDRGLVVGDTTFGKGLVQRVIQLRDGGALAVTTAKYYTPSGRLIQRDYSDLEEYYLSRGEDPDAAAELEGEKPVEREIFYTTSGRKVYGGGGIRPDYIVQSERAPEILLSLLRENLIFDFAVSYLNDHPDVEPGVPASPEFVEAFRSYLTDREFDYDVAALEQDIETVILRVRAQIARVHWDQEAESRVLAERDPQVQKALTLFTEAKDLAQQAEAGEEPTRVAELTRF